ncbi:MAG: DUF2380 domain-containing protein [Kofleriaceae bacterium]|nr:DUF2380 domain-containing protein [Kofleriaceae bacterium]MCL4225934.1 DUF2380 domain-containing protein [Myxococcales bacterium]
MLSASTTTWPSPQWSHTDVQQTLEDINGDGLPDLLRTNASGIVAHFNTGSSFETTARLVALLPFDREPGRSVIQALQGTSGNLQHGRRYGVHRFIDLDGDGLPEFIRNQGGHDLTPSIHPNHGGSFHLGLPGPLVPSPDVLFGRASDNGSWRVEAELMDLTGDGVPDAYDGGQLFTRVPWPAPRHVLRRVQNGRGAELHVKYRSTATIGDLGPARRGAAVWVVEEVTRISGAPSSTTSVVRYAYQGPLANADRRGRTAFRGFQTVTVTKDSGAATEHHFTYFLDAAGHGNLLWEGAIAEERVLEAGGFVAEQTTYEYTPLWLDSVHHAVVSSAVARQVIVPGSGPGQGADSPVVRTVSDWQPLTSGVAPNPVVAFRNATTVVSVLDPGPAPLVVPSRRTRTAGRLRYGPGEYLFLTTDELAEEELAPGSWQLATRTRLAYTNALPVLRRHLVDAGVEAIVRNVFHPSGVIYETSRPRHTAAGSGLVVRTEYDAFQLYPIATIDELGGRVLRQFDPATGALEVESSRTVATVLANAPRAETRHDGLGRPISRLRSHDDGTAITLVELERTQYTDGPESRIRVDQRLSFGADEWVVSEAFHDGWGRVVRQVEHTVRGPESTEYHYDAMGQLVSIVTLDVSQDDQSTASFKYTYDSLGRVVMRSTPEAAPLRTAYWGHVVEEWVDTTDGSLGRRVRYESDPAGRLRRVIERTATGEAVTAYEYDANDRVTAITNPDGALTRMFHDHGGRRVRVERGARTWRFQYDLHGNLEAELGPVLPGGDPLDHLNTYTYDELDRLITSRPGLGGLAAATPNAIASHGPTTFTYDQGCTGSNGFGRKCIVALPFGELRYGYTVEGWLETEQRSLSIPVDGATIQLAEQVAYGHDPDGEPNRVTYADGGGNSWRMEYTDNADGVPLAVAAGPVGAPSVTLATLTRGRGNVVRRRQGPVDQEQTWTYDSMGRVLGTRIVGASGVVVEQVADYWQTGNLRSLDTSSLDEPLDFQYDPQYQLVGVDSDGTNYLAAFTYSPAGRVMRAMVSSTLTGAQVVSRDVAYDYAGADEPVTALRRIADGSALAHMAHDAAGNTTVRLAEGDKSYFHYDALDRLRDADSSGSREIYLYSPDGDRIATLRKDGAWTVRHWFGPAETLYSPAGAVLDGTLHVGLGAGTVARLNRAPDSKPELVYADGLGNTLALLDLKGNTTALFAYGAFGETLLASGPSADGYHRRFNGEEWDEATGLIYYGFRFYDPLLLQWTQPDPMFRVSPDQDLRSPRLAGLYDFSLNNPLRYVDPDGLQPFSAAMAEMQREMCTDATQHPVLCPKEPSAFIHETWTDKYGDDEEEPAEDDDQGAEQAEGGKSFIGSAISFAIDVFVPQSATDVAMTASGAGVVTFLSKAAKVATKRKAVTKATKAGKGGKASAKAAKRTPTRYEYHHLTPQAFREELRLVAGVDVHDYTMRISRTLHIKLHSKRRMARLGKLDWNSAWKQEMRSGRLTSPEAVDRFVKKMVRDYGLPKNAIVRYPRAPRKQQ